MLCTEFFQFPVIRCVERLDFGCVGAYIWRRRWGETIKFHPTRRYMVICRTQICQSHGKVTQLLVVVTNDGRIKNLSHGKYIGVASGCGGVESERRVELHNNNMSGNERQNCRDQQKWSYE